MTENLTASASTGNRATKLKCFLILKIALFLNFLPREDYEKLARHIEKHPPANFDDMLNILRTGNFLAARELIELKNICLNFAGSKEDNRFGALCRCFNFLNRGNLDLALEEQERLNRSGKTVRLGELLVDAGMISKKQKEFVLFRQKLETPSQKTDPTSPPQAFDPTGMTEIRDNGLVLYITQDALRAYVKKTRRFNPDLSATDLKSILDRNGIIYGIKDAHRLADFIVDESRTGTPFEVASGLEPVHGSDAQITYSFEQEYLSAGNLIEDGTIDFKDRGEIPFVSHGDILAEKQPPKEGRNGVNVFGDPVFCKAAGDVQLTPGKGACLSKDGLTIIAEIDGSPKAGPGGEILVNSVHFIEGDVDYTTGHIKFDKSVVINGSIRNGFRVEAVDVVADTIDGGIVKAEGDVIVKNGITESGITSKGSITAGFIHRSDIECMGDLNIIKEITDATVNIEGKFKMPRGRMFSSEISARGGVKIFNIGSERARPSSIRVGQSDYFQKALAALDRKITSCQSGFETHTEERSKIEARLADLKNEIASCEHSLKRTLAMAAQMDTGRKKASDGRFALLKASQTDTEEKINALSAEAVNLEKQKQALEKTINQYSTAVKNRLKEKFSFRKINGKARPKPVVEVLGTALAGTRINGIHSTLILKRNLSRCRIAELPRNNGESSAKTCEMVVHHI